MSLAIAACALDDVTTGFPEPSLDVSRDSFLAIGGTMRAPWLLVFTSGVLSACAGKAPPPPTPPQHPVVARASEGALLMRSGSDALREFNARVEPQFEGGECVMVRNEPTPGVRTLVVHFPAREQPHTSVTITLDPAGKLVRYRETRGVPKPNEDWAAMQEQMRTMPRTMVSLDYVTGEAMAHNVGGGEEAKGIRGNVQEFEGAGVVRDVQARASWIEALCVHEGG